MTVSARQPPNRTHQLIVFLGSGRSGTTFVAKLFDSHPTVLYRHEPDSVNVNTSIPFLPGKDEIEDNLSAARTYLVELLETRNPKSSVHRPIFKKTYRSNLQQSFFTCSAYTSKFIEKFIFPHLRKYIVVPDFISEERRKDIVYVIKSVSSLYRTYLFSQASPQSKFIHIIRHPCGVIASRLRGIEKGLMKKDVYLESMFRLDDTRTYPFSFEDMDRRSLEEQMAYQWMIQNEKVFNEMSGKCNYRLVQYEILCKELDAQIRTLFNFVGLSWNQQTQLFIDRLKKTDRQTSKYFSVVRPLVEPIDRWRGQLTEEKTERIFDIVSHSHVGRLYCEGRRC